MTGLSDSFQRPINYMRVSVTDRCNLRCIYCMPAEGVKFIPHDEILSYEELYRVVYAGAELGITKIRITGGEPLVRAGLTDFIRKIAGIKALEDISMTTNGILLAQCAAELKEAGLQRVNVSLDTLKPERFERISRSHQLSEVLAGIEAAQKAGLNPVKINMVVMAGINDDEVLDFAKKTINQEWHIRFIELMPFTGHGDSTPRGITAREMKKIIDPLGHMEPFKHKVGNGPAKYFKLSHARGTIGFITALSEHFCFSCNRLRLTSDGKLRPCLMAEDEIDLKPSLRNGLPDDTLKELIRKAVTSKPMGHHLSEGVKPNDKPFCQVGG